MTQKEAVSTAIDKLVDRIVSECFPFDYVAGLAGKKAQMRQVIGEAVLTFVEETLGGESSL